VFTNFEKNKRPNLMLFNSFV